MLLSQKQEENRADSENAEDGHATMEEDNDEIFSFVRTAPVDQPGLKNRISEEERRKQDTETEKNVFGRVIPNWIEHKVPWTKLFNKRELNQRPNETRIDV